jgi:class 3 adenylate cyclase
VTEDERNQYLRRLRFPPELETAYRADYDGRNITLLARTSVVFSLLFIPLGIRDYLNGIAIGSLLGLYGPIVLALPLFAVLTRFPGFARIWQPYLAVVSWVMSAIVMWAVANVEQETPGWSTPEAKCCRLAIGLLLTMGVLGLTRLRFFWSAVTQLGLFITGIMVAVKTLPLPLSEVVLQFSRYGLPMLWVILLTNYTQERLSRAAFLANYLLDQEREKSENLLRNVLPDPIAERLKAQPGTIADDHPEATVLFADIVDFTPLSVRLSAAEVVSLLNDIFSEFDTLAEKYGLEKIKTIGDAYMVVGGLPEARADHARAVAEMALEMQSLISGFRRDTGEALQLRIGIHSGPVVAGVIGRRKFIYDLWGDTVNVASRMESHSGAGIIQVTEATRQLLRDEFAFSDARQIEVKGRGSVTTYFLLGQKPESGGG